MNMGIFTPEDVARSCWKEKQNVHSIFPKYNYSNSLNNYSNSLNNYGNSLNK